MGRETRLMRAWPFSSLREASNKASTVCIVAIGGIKSGEKKERKKGRKEGRKRVAGYYGAIVEQRKRTGGEEGTTLSSRDIPRRKKIS